MFLTIILVALLAWVIYDTYFRRLPVVTPLATNTTLLITGGCMGIGKQLALKLLKLDCTIIIVDIREDLMAAFQGLFKPSQLYFYKCDLSKQEEISVVFAKILSNHRKIDVLINNAGVYKSKMHSEETMQDVLLTNSVNYLAPVQLCKLLIPHMEAQGKGHIVNIGSVLSVIYGLKVPAYVASKHALYGFHNSLRAELKLVKSPVRTTFIAPWGVNTGMFEGFKTNLEFLIPILKEEFVAEEILFAIRHGKEQMSIRRPYLFLAGLTRLLPTSLTDKIAIYAQATTLNQLVGRR